MTLGKRESTRLRDLLLMRRCAKGSPNLLVRRMRTEHDQKISQKGASKKIQTLEENGYILDYIPVVEASLFGTPYLIQVSFDKTYRDVPQYLDDIHAFLKRMNCFAHVATYTLIDEDGLDLLSIIITKDIALFLKDLILAASLNEQIVKWKELKSILCIPNYDMHSI